jgi:UDP-N-acetylglucosamine:LPS N-acetylglucosamine transferase
MTKDTITFAMIEAGGGHKSPANAICTALRDRIPATVSVRVMDFCKDIGAIADDLRHKRGWDRALSRPLRTRMTYHLIDFLGPLTRWYIRYTFRDTRRRAVDWFSENRPKLFIATHFLNAAAAVHAKKKIPDFDSTIILFASDPHDISALWMWRDVDYLIVCSEDVKKKAKRRGFKGDKIKVFPYPINPNFFDIPSDTINDLASDPKDGCLTILMSAGGQGISKIGESVKLLIENDIPINIVVVCGKNEELYKKLSRLDLSTESRIQLQPLGFVNNMNELIQKSDLVVIKAGAASTYEALYLKKPIIFFEYVAYNEKTNIEYVIDKNLGWWVRDQNELLVLLSDLIENQKILDEKKEEFNSIKLQNGAEPIANFLYELYKER